MPTLLGTKELQGKTKTAARAAHLIASNVLYSACQLGCGWSCTTRLPAGPPRSRNQQISRHDAKVAKHTKVAHSVGHCKPNSWGSIWPVSADSSLQSRCHRCDVCISTPGDGSTASKRNEQQKRHLAKLSLHTCSSSTRSAWLGSEKLGLEVFTKLTDEQLRSHAVAAAQLFTKLQVKGRVTEPIVGRNHDEGKVCSPYPQL